MRRRSLLVCLLAVSCSGGRLLRDAAPLDGDGGGGDGAAGGNCPLAGVWQLQRITCGGQDMTDDYLARVPSTVLTLDVSPAGCSGSLTLTADFCFETETFTAEVQASSWSVTSNGITECRFEGCTFGFEDAPCQIGDGAGRRSENLSFGAQTFTTARFGGTFCPVNQAQIVTWRK